MLQRNEFSAVEVLNEITITYSLKNVVDDEQVKPIETQTSI